MTEKKLTNGITATIRQLSRTDIVDIKDLGGQRMYKDGSIGIVGFNKVQNAWIDRGLSGLGDWKAKNGEVVPDEIIMQLSDQEQFELVEIIKEAQIVNPKKPSN